MKLYLSSFEFGNEVSKLQALASGRRLGFIPNALDHVEPEARAVSNARRLEELRGLGIEAEVVDLAQYFGARDRLEEKLKTLGGVWVRGGNTFVLRQAMDLSAFDSLLEDRMETDFLYGGYSAGVCVLAPRLDGLQQVDHPELTPYPGSTVIWEGLGILDYLILPHYQSEHPESADIDKVVEYCRKAGIPFRTLPDGEVIIEDVARRHSSWNCR